MSERIPTVGIVVLSQSDVLLVEHLEGAGHMTGSFGTPGGRIEAAETPEEAAVRELYEEAGLQTSVQDLHKLPVTYEVDLVRKNGQLMPVSHTVFATKIFTGELVSSDETRPQWVNIATLSTMELLPNTEDMVRRAQLVLDPESSSG